MELHEYKKEIQNADGPDTRLGRRLWESDISKVKKVIKNRLISNSDIRELLDNPDFADTDDYASYLGVNIFPFIFIPNTISEKRNYICFKVDDINPSRFDGSNRNNPIMKVESIQFLILVHKDNTKTRYGMERHDALAFLIKQIFNWSSKDFPFRLRCVSDVEGVTDNNYASRTVTFETQDTNNLYEGRRQNAYDN